MHLSKYVLLLTEMTDNPTLSYTSNIEIPPPPSTLSRSSVRMPELHANLKMVYITAEHFWRCHPQYEHN